MNCFLDETMLLMINYRQVQKESEKIDVQKKQNDKLMNKRLPDAIDDYSIEMYSSEIMDERN